MDGWKWEREEASGSKKTNHNTLLIILLSATCCAFLSSPFPHSLACLYGLACACVRWCAGWVVWETAVGG